MPHQYSPFCELMYLVALVQHFPVAVCDTVFFRLQVDSLEIGSPALKGRKMLIQQLREFYSASSQHVGTLIAGDTLSPSEDMEEGGEEEEEEEGRGEEEVVVQESSPTVSKEELFRQFQLSYEDQLGTEDVRT